MNKIVEIVIAIFLIATLVPSALTTFMDVDTGTWTNATLVTVWGFLPILGVIALFLVLLRIGTSKRDKGNG